MHSTSSKRASRGIATFELWHAIRKLPIDGANKALLWGMAVFQGANEDMYATQATLAETISVSERAVRTRLTKLVADGYISATGEGKARRYSVVADSINPEASFRVEGTEPGSLLPSSDTNPEVQRTQPGSSASPTRKLASSAYIEKGLERLEKEDVALPCEFESGVNDPPELRRYREDHLTYEHEFISAANSSNGVRSSDLKMTDKRRRLLVERLRHPDWDWRTAFAKPITVQFAIGTLLEDPDSIQAILEGTYDKPYSKNDFKPAEVEPPSHQVWSAAS